MYTQAKYLNHDQAHLIGHCRGGYIPHTNDTTSLNILPAPQPSITFYTSPNLPGVLNRLFSAELFLTVSLSAESFWNSFILWQIVSFSNELFLHCPSVLSKHVCVLYKQKCPSFRFNVNPFCHWFVQMDITLYSFCSSGFCNIDCGCGYD